MPFAKPDPNLDALAVAVIKGLAMDATRRANSGHPGGPMSAADMAYVLFREFLRFDPRDPAWFNRDRFVLSAGHMSMLLYALLHFQDRLDLEDIKNFRQWGSKTPGHPEYGVTPGVEATTGPLGQGLGMAVGMAAAEALLRARLGKDICSHHTYVLASDGDLQEPVALGSAALAGHWGLGKLVVLYDANAVQLAGPVSRADTTDYAAVFTAMGWRVQDIDGHDHAAIRAALETAQAETERPSLIIGRTVMAKGAATLEGSSEAHGSPFSPEEIRTTKEKLDLPTDRDFHVPDEVLTHFRSGFVGLAAEVGRWRRLLTDHLDRYEEFEEFWSRAQNPRSGFTVDWPAFAPGKQVATRSAWGKCLMALAKAHPLVAGGSADLDPSNMTEEFREAAGVFGPDDPWGRSLSFGVREFPMAAIVNGMALHGGIVPFGATFLTFSDYCRGALRLAALQETPSLFVFTHDSFHLGEDGPTHQSVEHAASLRLIPGLLVLRPADANETVACLELALAEKKRPSCLLLTRQGLPVLDPAAHPALAHGPRRGGYVLQEAEGGSPEVVILAAGSEVSLALDAARLLAPRRVRVVSLPCLEVFAEQPAEYRREVLGNGAPRVAVEAGRPESWHRFVGPDGFVLGLDHFGHSAPAGVLAEKYGFTPANLARLIEEKLQTRE
ncbi:MAG: transketolase [Thermodesulfobacteriota bacterium]